MTTQGNLPYPEPNGVDRTWSVSVIEPAVSQKIEDTIKARFQERLVLSLDSLEVVENGDSYIPVLNETSEWAITITATGFRPINRFLSPHDGERVDLTKYGDDYKFYYAPGTRNITFTLSGIERDLGVWPDQDDVIASYTPAANLQLPNDLGRSWTSPLVVSRDGCSYILKYSLRDVWILKP
jgi:hypothetical protein